MQYRDLGKTGIKVSALAFGCMRFPRRADNTTCDRDASVALLKRAYELGVNYYDTAWVYDKGDSERTVGEFLKCVPRDRVIVADKIPIGNPWYPLPGDKPIGQFWREHLEEQLRRLQTGYIDVCLFHDTVLPTFQTVVRGPGGPIDQARKAKDEGLIRHIALSSHDSPANIIRILEQAAGVIEVIVVQYNLLDRKNEPVIEYARKNGIGVAVMGPIGGGRLIHPSEVYQKAVSVRSTAELALRFVLGNPGVSCAMSGMNSLAQLEENARTASEAAPLTREEIERIDKLQQENRKFLHLYCTGCGYCLPCPHGVNIPGNFHALNILKVHGFVPLAKQTYENLKDGKAERCEECGACVPKCPQEIKIPDRLKEVVEAFRT